MGVDRIYSPARFESLFLRPNNNLGEELTPIQVGDREKCCI